MAWPWETSPREVNKLPNLFFPLVQKKQDRKSHEGSIKEKTLARPKRLLHWGELPPPPKASLLTGQEQNPPSRHKTGNS